MGTISWNRQVLGPGHNARPVLVAAMLVFLGALAPIHLGIELTRGISTPGPRSVDDVLLDLGRQGFDLDAVAAAGAQVPRVFLTALPRDWRDLAQAAERKRAFTMVVLPLVLRTNEMLFAVRGRVQALSARLGAGGKLSEKDRDWILELATHHKVEVPEVTEKVLAALERKIDIVPPSLAIAQAAIESGWGTSRYTTEGNALFGQWAEESEDSMVPSGRDAGRTYAIQSFSSLIDSVSAYMRNLNSHRAYRRFRAARAEMRSAGQAIAGPALAKHLGAYSQQGPKYIRALVSIIEKNNLDALDRAALGS